MTGGFNKQEVRTVCSCILMLVCFIAMSDRVACYYKKKSSSVSVLSALVTGVDDL
jgi:hypothetical protein